MTESTPTIYQDAPYWADQGETRPAPQCRETGRFRVHETVAVLEALGEVVYAIRCKDGCIKIGHTGNFAARRRFFSTDAHDTLAFAFGTLEDEQAIHATLVPYRARGWEYYHAVPEVLAVVNEMREALNLEPLAS